ncbi:AraC family transcriptional regulator [Actinomadura sp. WAC 06369]|uniref:AraC family transcriptional regulator n=1 Tax=Actinomadura sp. WAC 06369 TaxID=2203193 RepID=UPI0013151710|nr:AraC family transcriptional regulator [Actinomadura sp. WAC 06369]
MTSSTLPGDVTRRLARIGERQGLDSASLLRRAGIAADVASPTTGAGVTLSQAAELTQELWILTGDELFGLGPAVPLGSFQLMMRSVIHVPDLRAALQRLAEASEAMTGMPRLRVAVRETLVEVEIDVSRLDDPDHLGGDILATLIHRVLGWLIGRRIGLRELRLPWPETPYAADYEIVFGRHPVFGADRLALAFDRRLLTAPLVRDEQQLADYLADQPNVWFATRDYGTTVADRVRKILERGLRGHWPTPDDIAAQLSVSTQHLRRLLRAEHTSIRQLKEDLLREAAVASLARGEESVEELARRLGFSEASAFRRAFRRWTGRPPGAYRGADGAAPAAARE